MSALILVIIILSAITTVANVMAFLRSRELKIAQGSSSPAILTFWFSVSVYTLAFTFVRIAHFVGSPLELEIGLFYAQTAAGASTLISLSTIVLQLYLPKWPSGYTAGIITGIAAVTLFLIYSNGVTAQDGDWSVTFLPNSLVARGLVGGFYVILPVLLATTIMVSVRNLDERVLHRRLVMFAASVVLIYVPNAITYVFAIPDFLNVILVTIVMIGAIVGSRSYVQALNSH